MEVVESGTNHLTIQYNWLSTGVQKVLNDAKQVNQVTEKNIVSNKKLNAAAKTLENTQKQSSASMKILNTNFSDQIAKVKHLEQVIQGYHALKKKGIELDNTNALNMKNAISLYNGMGGQAKKLMRNHQDLLSSFTRFRWALVNVMLVFYSLQKAYNLIIKPSIELEAEMSNVRKTAGLTIQQTRRLSDEMVALSRIIPVTAEELAKIAGVAGQLGIRGDDIRKFTTTVGLMTIATSMGAEEAATSLAKISNAFNIDISGILQVGSVINELENTTAASAEEIVSSLKNVGVAATTLGIDFTTSAAMMATLISTGISAERAGTRLKRLFVEIASNMEDFSGIAGKSMSQFSTDLNNMPKEALLDLLRGLNNAKSDTERMAQAFEAGGTIGGVVFLNLADNIDELEQSIQRANDEWDKSITLIKEAGDAAETTKSQWALLMADWRITGQEGAINKSIGFLRDVTASFKAVDAEWNKKFGKGGNAALSAISPFAGLVKGASTILHGPTLLYEELNELQDEFIKKSIEAGKSEEYLNDAFADIKSRNGYSQQKDQLLKYMTTLEKATKLQEKEAQAIDKSAKYLESLNLQEEYNKRRSATESTTGKTAEDISADIVKFEQFKNMITSVYSESAPKLIEGLSAIYGASNNASSSIKDLTSAVEGFNNAVAKLTLSDNSYELYQLNEQYVKYAQLAYDSEKISFAQVDAWYDMSRAALDYKNTISDLQSKISDATSVLSDLKEELSDVNSEISSLSNAKFTGELGFQQKMSEYERYLKEIDFTELTGMSAFEFINATMDMSNAQLKEFLATFKAVNKETDTGKDSYEAWRETVSAFITDSIQAGNELGMGVSNAVGKYSTLLLSTSRFEDSTSNQQDAVGLLGDAYDIYYGGMHDDVQNQIDLHDQEATGVYENAQQIISALQEQWTAQENLTSSIDTQQTSIDTLNETLQNTQDEYESLKEDIFAATDSMLDFMQATLDAVQALKDLAAANALAQEKATFRSNYQRQTQSMVDNAQNRFRDTTSSNLDFGGDTSHYYDNGFSDSTGILGNNPSISFGGGSSSGGNNGASGSWGGVQVFNPLENISSGFSDLWDSLFPMAAGGIVSKPTPALIGEAGPEAVIPLDKLGNMGTNVTIANVNISGVNSSNPSDFAYKFAQELKRELRTQ